MRANTIDSDKTTTTPTGYVIKPGESKDKKNYPRKTNFSIGMKFIFLMFVVVLLSFKDKNKNQQTDLILKYYQPARSWNEALPVGNGRLGAMVFGTVQRERIQFNEETLWTGGPHDYSHPGASEYLDTLRQLVFAGKPREAEKLAMEKFMSIPLGQKAYQPFGDLYIDFPGHENYTDYERSLDISQALCQTKYKMNGITFTREVLASHPDQVIVIRLKADKKKALSFGLIMDSPHENKKVTTQGSQQTLTVAVTDGVLNGLAKLKVETDGIISDSDKAIKISDAGSATIYLSAATNFVSYKDVSGDPAKRVDNYFAEIKGKSYKEIRKVHIEDYQSLFNRFSIGFGSSGRDSVPMDKRLQMFSKLPEDPGLIALYVQYGRYLMISSSRPGTMPANLQGIWNQDLKPAWDSKYTTNINVEMNYWPAEVTNLSDCTDPLFRLIEECSQTGVETAKVHYNADGWILHHNTDIWRGTAPINHSNHGIWVSGSGWLCRHMWEHYLFTKDADFLRNRAWPVMREAARFYSQYLIKDPKTGYLISTPSNSPEIGGLVAGPTMDHQIIRSLFESCVEASAILDLDQSFAKQLKDLIPMIAPNQVGKHGQLQEWMEDKDNPNEHHRHVSHLWGVYPGADVTWEKSPDFMKAARQSLLYRGDEGTGWSLAWKINFWARFLEGDHAYELIKLLFRLRVDSDKVYSGGSYMNLFDACPPFQIDGNFGAPAGIVELIIQSHQGVIDILPALPSALHSGFITGVCARGAFELDFGWKAGKLIRLSVLSEAGTSCKMRYQGKTIEFQTVKGKKYLLGTDFSF